MILQSIYWTYSWPCKQLKKIWSVICAQFKLLYHMAQDIVICLCCQQFKKKKIWRRKKKKKHRQGMREDSSIFQSLHAASIVNWEILHWQQKKRWHWPKNPILFTFSIFLSSNLSVYCSKLLKVMLELHTMSRCCCQSFAVYFFIPTRGQDIYIYIYKKSIYIYIYIYI